MTDSGENPDAPQPREMIDLEVRPSLTWLISKSVVVFPSLYPTR
jgi:hypothetical protein